MSIHLYFAQALAIVTDTFGHILAIIAIKRSQKRREPASSIIDIILLITTM